MSRRRPRGLKPEEQELWDRVRARTHPLHPVQEKRKPHQPAPPPPASPARPVAPAAKAYEPPRFRIGEKAGPGHGAQWAGAEQPRPAPLKMDRKRFTDLRRGKLAPEARIDLHGMTLAQAHPALIRFILGAHAGGKRLVLVITGKGRGEAGPGPIPERRGILRQQVPHWLQGPPLSSVVLQTAPAHRSHGGEGALYVYLRRHRR